MDWYAIRADIEAGFTAEDLEAKDGITDTEPVLDQPDAQDETADETGEGSKIPASGESETPGVDDVGTGANDLASELLGLKSEIEKIKRMVQAIATGEPVESEADALYNMLTGGII
jgi:hypothetical protein